MAKPEKSWSHSDLSALAVKWLRRPNSANGHGCNISMSELKSGWTGEIPDAIGFKLLHPHSESVVVEVKTSRSDFLADRNKPHRIRGGMGNYRYFMVPQGLISPGELPSGWGLLEVNSRGHIKPMAGPAAFASKNYNEWTTALEQFRNEADTVREQWLLVKLLSQVGDPEEMNNKRKEVYRELDRVRAAHNRLVSERDELAKDNRRLVRELRLLSPVATPRNIQPEKLEWGAV